MQKYVEKIKTIVESRSKTGGHLFGTIESYDDPRRIGQRVITHQLLEIDLR